MKIEFLTEDSENEYSNFLLSQPDTLFYHSVKYKNLLKEFLNCEERYLIVKVNNSIIAALPLMLYRNSIYGNVLNSLPFFGSNGAIITHSDSIEAKRLLLDSYYQLLTSEKCVAGTLITSPFESNIEFYEANLKCDFIDQRIGQITFLPENENDLMGKIHSKTRNIIRKGMGFNIRIDSTYNESSFKFLFDTHKDNMTLIDGLYKPESFFNLLKSNFSYGDDYLIYTAYLDNEPIAGLLNLYFNKTVEYFTPVIKSGFRECQPLSLTIYEAMKDAIRLGYKNWNWGGTWLTQDGVYEFKRKWGTTDFKYFYFSTINAKSILSLRKEELLKNYSSFFVLPFSKLNEVKESNV